MDSFLKRLTPAVLLVLAGLIVFERWIPGSGSFAKAMGADALVRFVVAVLCIYVLLLVTERQRLEAKFTQVLHTFKQFYAGRASAAEGQAGGGGPGMDPETARKQALPILLAALESSDPEVRETALENLRRLTGHDLGADVAAWRERLDLPKSKRDKGQGK